MINAAQNYDRELLGTLNVLYVEDADFAREALAYYLKRRCKTVDVASNGKIGLEMFQTHRYDVVLTDIRMPVMDGLEMARSIKSIDKDVPVIVITAHAEIANTTLAEEIGVNDFIRKPVYPERVTEAICKCVQAVQPRP